MEGVSSFRDSYSHLRFKANRPALDHCPGCHSEVFACMGVLNAGARVTHPLRLWHSGMKQWTYSIFVFAHSRTLKECNSSKNVSDRWKSDVQGVIANPTWAGKYRQGQFSGVTKTFVCRWCVSSCSTVAFRVCVNVWHLKMKSSSWRGVD